MFNTPDSNAEVGPARKISTEITSVFLVKRFSLIETDLFGVPHRPIPQREELVGAIGHSKYKWFNSSAGIEYLLLWLLG